MKQIANIYVAWRRGPGHRRYLIGKIRHSVTDGITFSYLAEGVNDAQKEGFTPFTEFPNIDRGQDNPYKSDVIKIFGQRLLKSERLDAAEFYEFWDISPGTKHTRYYLLAKTQGLLPTDNFEFLADYNPVKGLSFITDLAGLSHLQLSNDSISVGDELDWEFEEDNPIDQRAIKVYKKQLHIGYIKKVHSEVFHKKSKYRLKIKVKALEKNGKINKVFVLVSF